MSQHYGEFLFQNKFFIHILRIREMKYFRLLIVCIVFSGLTFLISCDSSTNNNPEDNFGFIVAVKIFPESLETNLVKITEPAGVPEIIVQKDGHNAITPTVSPDGSTVVFSANFMKETPLAQDPPGGSLYKVSSDGGTYTRITDADWIKISEYSPCFSPDGQTIAYVRVDGDIGPLESLERIWLMNSDGTNRRPLIDDEEPYSCVFPVFSPDGSKIAFITNKYDVFASDLVLMNSDGSGEISRLTVSDPIDEAYSDPFFDSSGQWIYFFKWNSKESPEYSLMKVSVNGGTPELVMEIPAVDSPRHHVSGASAYFDFSNAVNGDGFVFVSCMNDYYQIYTTEEFGDDFNKTMITGLGDDYFEPVWWKEK
jgi:Tol biopolymer transport system component